MRLQAAPAHALRLSGWNASQLGKKKKEIRLYGVLVSRMITCGFHPRSPSACCITSECFPSALPCIVFSGARLVTMNQTCSKKNGTSDETLRCPSAFFRRASCKNIGSEGSRQSVIDVRTMRADSCGRGETGGGNKRGKRSTFAARTIRLYNPVGVEAIRTF